MSNLPPSTQGPAWTPSLSHLQDLAATVSATGKLPSQLAADVETLKGDLATAIADCNRSREIIYAMSEVLEPREGESNIDCAKRVRAAVETLRAALDTLTLVIDLTAIKYPEHLPPLQEALDTARAALAQTGAAKP